jgi:MFS family permease
VGAASTPRVGYRDALRSREFTALFVAQATTIAGSSIAAVALTVLVYDRTGSAFLSSLTFALGFLPYVLAGLFSGVVDRVRPRVLVNISTGASAAIALAMAVPGIPIAVLLTMLFALGLLTALSGGARVALLRSTVSDAAYVPGRSLMKLASQIAQIGGNAVGGTLVAAIGTSGAILVNAGSFALAFALVRFGVADHASLGESRAAGLLHDSLAGAREIFATPSVGRLLLLGWLVPMFSVARRGSRRRTSRRTAARRSSSAGGSPPCRPERSSATSWASATWGRPSSGRWSASRRPPASCPTFSSGSILPWPPGSCYSSSPACSGCGRSGSTGSCGTRPPTGCSPG